MPRNSRNHEVISSNPESDYFGGAFDPAVAELAVAKVVAEPEAEPKSESRRAARARKKAEKREAANAQNQANFAEAFGDFMNNPDEDTRESEAVEADISQAAAGEDTVDPASIAVLETAPETPEPELAIETSETIVDAPASETIEPKPATENSAEQTSVATSETMAPDDREPLPTEQEVLGRRAELESLHRQIEDEADLQKRAELLKTSDFNNRVAQLIDDAKRIGAAKAAA